MLRQSDAYHQYHSAHKRFLKSILEDFFLKELPNTFGPNLRGKIAEELITLFNKNNLDKQTIKPGQVLWNAVHKTTRADYRNCKYVPVVLTLVNDDDITNREKGLSPRQTRQGIIARITREAYEQDALLSMRDISLLLNQHPTDIGKLRIEYEMKTNTCLPHTGNLQDMGSCITHKYQIVYKYVVEKKDPSSIAKETNHSIKAVDHYLKDFNRIKLLFFENKTPEFIRQATGIQIHVVKQYLNIINQYLLQDVV
jgi:hypothetical protein